MAFVDDYSPINFVDLPNDTTPFDAENLNKMDSQIKKLSTFASTTDLETTEDRLSGLEEKTNSLKEDLSNKITKFYASNQGETHLADSDNGKIQDMMIYGKSSQDGTPTPENPVKWSEVENATSYRVRITKADGTYKEFDTTHTSFYSTNYTDDFIADGMDGATVSVRAYGDNDTFGCWSDDTNITRFGY